MKHLHSIGDSSKRNITTSVLKNFAKLTGGKESAKIQEKSTTAKLFGSRIQQTVASKKLTATIQTKANKIRL